MASIINKLQIHAPEGNVAPAKFWLTVFQSNKDCPVKQELTKEDANKQKNAG